MSVRNIQVVCSVLQYIKERNGLVLIVRSEEHDLFPGGYPVFIVVPYKQGTGYTYRGETLRWIPFADALVGLGLEATFTVRITGKTELVESAELYPGQPRKNWPSNRTWVIIADSITVE
ncbi:MAG: hypothetical protein PHY34_05035 [Patescibacteria group bacterium]|nr:hypothetical protein [Patescibacteria group bacterium]MDD5715526.1 hypothetical protein [Patescibacteria group bacterium]